MTNWRRPGTICGRQRRRLFQLLPSGATAVVNVDDRDGAELAASLTTKRRASTARGAVHALQ